MSGPGQSPRPAVSVVVPSHGRFLRLLWLLNALEDQELDPGQWDVVVVHDYASADQRRLLDEHPLAVEGRLRVIAIPEGSGSAAIQRNMGWRQARADLIAFTDDDCRPDERWLAQLLAAAERHPGTIVQGRSLPDPLEVDVYASPHARTVQERNPPGPFAQTCNILYPRATLELVNGFDEQMALPAGEDLDLKLRVTATGVPYAGAPDAVVFHCIEGYTIVGAIRLARKWQFIALLAKRHREVRTSFPLRIFWRATHLRLVLALAGILLGRFRPLFVLLALPYVAFALSRRGTHPAARLASAIELPGHVVVDLAEIGFLIRGSIRHRTLVL